MRIAVRSSQFRRDVKRAEKRGKNLGKLRTLLMLLLDDAELSPHYRDHPLKGEWAGYRDAHVEPDWLLVYRIVGDELQLVRTGTHADLFKE